MANNIDSMTNQYLQISGRSTQTHGPDKPVDRSQPTTTSGSPSQSVDTINLTDDARLMQAVESKLSTVAEVDARRVEDVRNRLESGSYQISSERTADKMLAMDQSIPGES